MTDFFCANNLCPNHVEGCESWHDWMVMQNGNRIGRHTVIKADGGIVKLCDVCVNALKLVNINQRSQPLPELPY